MLNRDYSVKHDTFTLERHYNAPPARAYAAWADSTVKAKWFPPTLSSEFRIGGKAIVHGGPPEGPVYTSVATFEEIATDNRIVYTVTIDMDDTRISVSVVTVQFMPSGVGTRLVYTEQCAFFDGLDKVEDHIEGAQGLLDSLAAELESAN